MQDNGDGQGRDSSNSLQFKRRLKILHGMAERQQRKRRLKLSRWNRHKWMHAALFTSLGIMVATIVPGFSSTMRQTEVGSSLATLPLQLPSVEETLPQESFHDNWQSIRIRAGQTVSALFKEYGLPQSSLHALMGDKNTRAALTKLRPGNEIALNLSNEGELRGLRYDRDPTHRVELVLDGGELRENVIERETSTRTVVISGKVGRSLFHSARKLGLTGGNINALTDDIFKYDIDFNQDVAASDRFSVVVEQTWREGELIKSGPIKAATFTARGKLHSAFLFERNGKAEYFTGEGRPLRKSFIRMPISYARLSSNFGARRHPVLGSMRMHKGVDYAAKSGTPIMAAGDARVQFVGKQNGYGNVVILDHGKGHTTLYAHMSRFGGIKKGQRVAQGTVIGYVGSTGLATGPHLHYEFRVNGVHRNPLNVTMPPPEPLNGTQMVAFRSYTANALERIRTVENLIYADVDRGKDVAATTTAATPEKKG